MEEFNIEDLTFSYPGISAPALRDVSLKVEKGSFAVLCGPSGSGKTTLLRCLKPCLAPHGAFEGRILFEGQPISDVPERELAAKIGFVRQSPDEQIVTDKVWHELAFGLESLGLPNGEIRARVAEMASFFGIEDWFYRDVSALSGGQKQILCLASVMAMQPEALILDEPTSQLDPIAAADFLACLERVNRELGTTVIISEQRLGEVLPMADEVIVLEKGSAAFCGSSTEVGRFLRESGSTMFSAMPCRCRSLPPQAALGIAPSR